MTNYMKQDYGPAGCCQSTMIGGILGALLGLKLAGWLGRRRNR